MTVDAASADARLARIALAVQARAPLVAERDEPFFEAAVALVLRTTPAGVIELLFIKRAERHDDPWSGQIALPGGRYDPDDESLEATAVRETFEEVSIDLRRDGDPPADSATPAGDRPSLCRNGRPACRSHAER
jgi:8-oxo-dGTP pyrophosphatase MutT (NUDIX family)